MLYTKKGDQGTTKIFNTPSGVRISKSDPIFEALGSVDELNSFLGLVKVNSEKINFYISSASDDLASEKIIHKIQEDLFIIQAEIAGSDMTIEEGKVLWLEDITNRIEAILPPITTFFISGGTEIASLFDISRTLARRCERSLVSWNEESERKLGIYTLAYINRLSSVLYALARLSNHFSGIKEESPKY